MLSVKGASNHLAEMLILAFPPNGLFNLRRGQSGIIPEGSPGSGFLLSITSSNTAISAAGND